MAWLQAAVVPPTSGLRHMRKLHQPRQVDRVHAAPTRHRGEVRLDAKYTTRCILYYAILSIIDGQCVDNDQRCVSPSGGRGRVADDSKRRPGPPWINQAAKHTVKGPCNRQVWLLFTMAVLFVVHLLLLTV
jgi:hypothetical protein